MGIKTIMQAKKVLVVVSGAVFSGDLGLKRGIILW